MADMSQLVIKFIAAKQLRKEGKGPKVTLASFAREECINPHTFRYHLNRFKSGALNKVKEKRIKSDNNKRQSDKVEIDNTKRFDFTKLRLEYLYGHYPSIKAFAIHYGISPNNGHFRRQTAGWAKEKAILETERRKYSIKDLRNEALDDTLEDVTATIKNIGKRMNQALDIPMALPGDVSEKVKLIKMLCEVQDFEVKQYKTLSVLGLEKNRREFTRRLNSNDITIEEFAGLMDLEGLPLTPSQMEALKAYYREEPVDDFGTFDIAEIERQDEEQSRKTLQTIERIKLEAEGFINTRENEVLQMKKDLAPAKDPFKPAE